MLARAARAALAASVGGPWCCPHCGVEITPILDPEEYDFDGYIGEGGVLTAECWNCEEPVTVRCHYIPAYEVIE